MVRSPSGAGDIQRRHLLKIFSRKKRDKEVSRMRNTLKPGDVFSWSYVVPLNKTVPYFYPESEEYRKMPEIFATGFMVGLLEWCCIEALRPHLEEGEGSLGTFISTTHVAPTLPGMKVTVTALCDEIREGNNIFWSVVARDDMDLIAQGRHGRHVIETARFQARMERKSSLFLALSHKSRAA
ncbi:thioesterase family protein [Verminephrobacter aporrectodeae]|uniref:thioesterase family protein n=1 Tax=Verminephrobacter aporrectodeae TaxID=1110389 RepID=UPI002243AC6C|nr:thioesterase family protein [Verminephrobacter aporrectodeae]